MARDEDVDRFVAPRSAAAPLPEVALHRTDARVVDRQLKDPPPELGDRIRADDRLLDR
jgi:hypothetical protein